MQKYLSFINFSQLCLSQKCDFITNRISPKISTINKRLLATIYEQLLDNERNKNEFATLFSKLYDELNQLLRLETLVLFQYIKACEEKSQPVNISENSIDQYKKHQLQIQKLILSTRIAFIEIIGTRPFTYIESIIDNDLFLLDELIKEWSLIMNHYILTTNKSHVIN